MRIRDLVARTVIVGLAALGSVQPVFGQGARVSSPTELARVADELKPGEWVWAPNVAPDGPLLIYVDLSRQLATVYRNGVRIAISTISSGRAGYETPTGVFTILQKDASHHSNKYNSAPMPFQQRLTWDGVALHAGGLPGYPESHGCVHLPYTFSQVLFGITRLGATVVVTGNATSKVQTADSGLLLPVDATGRALEQSRLDSQEYRWTPDKAPAGPLTIIVSKHDQTIVVLRNGVEIGRSVADVGFVGPASHVLTLKVTPDGQQHWVYVGLPGHEDENGRELEQASLDMVRLPRGFYESVKAQVRPGTTILVTDSSVGENLGTRKMTILDSVNPRP